MKAQQHNKPKLSLILGSGFSAEAQLPVTRDLHKNFLKNSKNLDNFKNIVSSFPQEIQIIEEIIKEEINEFINNILSKFWKKIFGFDKGSGRLPPSLEDHFTVIDLAANSGHNLSSDYNPKKLRAIRRFSIHRIFEILNSAYQESPYIKKLLKNLNEHFNLSIVTLNWDIVVEKHLGDNFTYQIDVKNLNNPEDSPNNKGISILKVHGSANWIYCDNCHRLYYEKPEEGGKSTIHRLVLIEPEDFQILGAPEELVKKVKQIKESGEEKCPYCDNQLSTRVATFSYRKDLSISQFRTLWEYAFKTLSESDIWLFIGYSLPDADFEFKHLLKSAQLARKNREFLKIKVILLNDEYAKERYCRFFGLSEQNVYQKGLSSWINCEFQNFLNNLYKEIFSS